MRKLSALAAVAVLLGGCVTITIANDSYIPVTVSFSDGSEGECEFQNKHGVWTVRMPGTKMIHRSDDALVYRCETDDGRKATGLIVSKIDGAKLAKLAKLAKSGASTDAITDKDRTYQRNVTIRVPAKKSWVLQ